MEKKKNFFWVIQNADPKWLMVFVYYVRNKWRHLDIIAILKRKPKYWEACKVDI